MSDFIHEVSDDSLQTSDDSNKENREEPMELEEYSSRADRRSTDEDAGAPPRVRVLIAVDAGRSSVRAACYEYHGVGDGGHRRPLVGEMEGLAHEVPVQCIVPGTGRVRVHEALWAIDECVDGALRLLRQCGFGYRVVGVGVSTFATNLIGVDISGDPVGDAATLSSACDGGSREDVAEECKGLIDHLGQERLSAMHQRTGAPGVYPSHALPQLLAFYNDERNNSLIKRVERWQSVSCTIVHRWTGSPHLQIPLSYSEASRTGMLDFRSCTWDEEAMDLLERCNDVYKRLVDGDDDDDDDRVFNDGVDLLPPMTDHDSALPFLVKGIPERRGDDGSTNSYWERWPELRSASCRLFLGVVLDGATEGVSGSDRRIDVSIGTSAAAWACLPLPAQFDDDQKLGHETNVIKVPEGIFCYRVDRARVILGGALAEGGSVVEWARSLLNLEPNEAFDACLAEVSKKYNDNSILPPGSLPSHPSSGITMIPFLGGRGASTGFHGRSRGCISGITRETTAADIMHACLESMVLQVGQVLRLVNGAIPWRPGGGRGILVASGDALEHSFLWRQMLADCASMDVVVDGNSGEGASRGVAIMMAGSLRLKELGNPMAPYNFGDEPLAVTRKIKASPAMEEYWRTAMLAQESLFRAIAPTWSIR